MFISIQLLHVNGTRLYICCEQAVEYNDLMEGMVNLLTICTVKS